MKVLLTNVEMDGYSGTTLYVKELALSFQKKGIKVEVYTKRIGPIGISLQAEGILVTTKIKDLTIPDIIHCHHNITAQPLLSHFTKSPMIFWVHSRLSPLDIPPKHRNIVQYMAVDYNCQERYVVEHGFSAKSVGVIYNWVNLDRFRSKTNSEKSLKRALVFSNYATEEGFLPIIRTACKQLNIELDVMGQGTDSAQNAPEDYLGDYDLVFAKAKAAMEAMACGCAVIVCDFTGLAGLVTSYNYEEYRRLNFGMKLMTRSITTENITEELKAYQTLEVNSVNERLRSEADMELTTDKIQDLYERVIDEYKSGVRGAYGFHLGQYLLWRKATFRIWIGLWANLHLPFVSRVLKR